MYPGFKPKFIMGDDAFVFYNAFVAVFPEMKNYSQRLICRWHVLQTWGRRAKARRENNEMYIPNVSF